MKRCECYREQTERYYYSEFERGFTMAEGRTLPQFENQTYGVCWGTKERDRCGCGGDVTMCDFYPEKREKIGVDCKSCPYCYYDGGYNECAVDGTKCPK